MRRLLLSVIGSTLYISAFAQEIAVSKTCYYRHEVNVSIGTIGVRPNFTNSTNSDNHWYTLDGRRLDGQPSRAGVYIYIRRW